MFGKYILEGKTPKLVDNVLEWAKWFETANRRVNETDIGIPTWKFWLGKLLKIKRWEPVHISTVFLGLDHSFDGGTPLLFETMIFGGRNDGSQERYATWEEAEAGHHQAVKIATK